MAEFEDVRFDIRSNEFNKTISEFEKEDENSWSLLDSRQFEIMDSVVSNEKKAAAMDRVLWEISRIHPRADTAYCQALEKRVALTHKRNQTDLLRMARDAYMHRRTSNMAQYGKIIYDIYQKLTPENKKTFAYIDTAKAYRKAVANEQKKQEREHIIDRLREIDFYLEDPSTTPERKLSLIDETLQLVREKYFGYVKANKIKAVYCGDAVNICRRELFDAQGADYYLTQKKEYERRADKAFLHTEEGNTEENRQKYMQKYRSDNER